MAKSSSGCDCGIIHEETVKKVLQLMPDEDVFSRMTVFFKLLGDHTRIKIIWSLYNEEMCVCDLANVLNMSKSAVSHQLGALRRANLVKRRQSGKTAYYALSDEHVNGMLISGLEHVHE